MIAKVGRVEFIQGQQGYQAKVCGENEVLKERQIFVEKVPNSPCVQFAELSHREQEKIVRSIGNRRISFVSDETARVRSIIIRAIAGE